MIVVDTNTICYFYLPGPHAKAAQRAYLKDPEWSAPHLWRSELRNVLIRSVRQNQLTVTDAIDIMQEAEALLLGREYDLNSQQVLQLAAISGCTAYDCEFVALAINFNVPLVTLDKQVLRTFPAVAIALPHFAT